MRLPVIIPPGDRGTAAAGRSPASTPCAPISRPFGRHDTSISEAGSAQLGAPAQGDACRRRRCGCASIPKSSVRIEGHGDPGDTRDHALAIGARRAEEVRNYLVLLGVPAAQLSAMSWGKERPGPPRAVTVLVR